MNEEMTITAAGAYDRNHSYTFDESTGTLLIFKCMVRNLLPVISRRQLRKLRIRVKHVVFEESCTMSCITVGMFRDYCNLISVRLCSSITELKSGAFEGCVNLKTINTDGVVYFGKAAFRGCSHLQDIRLDRAQEVGRKCFEFCIALEEARYSDRLTRLGSKAYKDCANLKMVKGTGEVDLIGKACFMNNFRLTDCDLPGEAATIGAKAFERTGITGAIGFSGNVRICRRAFADCYNIDEINFYGKTFPKCAYSAFRGVSAVVHYRSEEAYERAACWGELPMGKGLRWEFMDLASLQNI